MSKYQIPRGTKIPKEVKDFMKKYGHVRTVAVGNIFRENEIYYFLPIVIKEDRDGDEYIVHIQDEWPRDFKIDPPMKLIEKL